MNYDKTRTARLIETLGIEIFLCNNVVLNLISLLNGGRECIILYLYFNYLEERNQILGRS